MAFESRLEIIVDSSRAQGSLKRLEGDLNRTQAAGEKAFSGLQKGAMAFGAAFAAIGAGAAFKNTISTIMDFQAEMSGLQAVARASVEDLARLEQQARLLGATTAYGANQAAQAQKFLAQGGLEVNQILGATPQVMRLAQAGMLGLGEAADLATDVMAAMSLQISDIGRIGDVLVATSQAATTDVQGLGQALSYSAGQGADFNLTLEETVAALGMISSTGAKGSRAGTGLVGVIAQLSNVSGPAKDILDEANVSLADLNVEARGLVPVLETLAAANLSAGERQKIFGLEAAGAAGALLNGLPAYKAQIEALQDVNGLSEEAAKTMTDNLGGAFKGLGSAIAEANLQLGDSGLTKTLDAIVKTGTGVVQIFNGMGDEWAASTEGGERFLSTAQSLVDTLEALAIVAGTRLATALITATTAQGKKLLATQASLKAETAAASAVVRRTSAEALAEKRLLGRAIAEAKATQGTQAHAGALAALNVQRARSIQASTANKVAVNAEAAAMTRASVAARGMAAASKAGAGALALMGGPLGAAVIATGAIFHFREELGLVARPAITAAGAVDELALRVDGAADSMLKFEVAAFTAELVSLQAAAQQAEANLARLEETKNQPSSFGQGQQGDLWAGVDRQSAQLESLNNQINAREEAIGKLTDRINQLKESEDNASDSTRNLNINIAGLDEEAAKAAKTLADNFESLKRQLDPSYSSLMDFWEGIELLNEAIDTTTIEGMTEYNRLVGLLTERYAEATKGSDDAAKRMKSLTDTYDRAHVKAQQLTADLAAINEAWRNDPANGDQYARMVASVREEMAELALEADPVAKELARLWEEAGERIDETFADAFTGAFDSFDSFADQLLDGFKRLLGELAYQATLKPIVVGFTQDMQGLLGIGGGSRSGGFGGIGSLISGGKSLLGLGSTAATGTALSGGFMGAAATQSAGSLYGMAATGGVAQAGLASSIAAGISTAMPWIAGGLAIDSLLGGGITKAISGLFGGKSRGPSFDLMTTNQDPRTIFEDVQHGVTATGAFGNVGFHGGNTNRLEETFGSFDNATQFLETIAATDDMIAALAPGDVEAMTYAIQQMRLKSSDAAGIADQLGDRTKAAFGAMSGDFGAFARTLSGSTEEIIAQAQATQQAHALLTGASERLGLQFNIAGGYAYEAAQDIAQLAGGVENLSALQQSYYQNFFSEAERAAHLTADLTSALGSMGLQLPETREGFRQLVEAQDLSTESGRQAYAQLLQLSASFSELTPAVEAAGDAASGAADALREREQLERQLLTLQGNTAELRRRDLDVLDSSNRGLQQRIWALEDEQEAQRKAEKAQADRIRKIEQEASAWQRAQQQLASFGVSIDNWIDNLSGTDAGLGTPGDQLAAASQAFDEQYAKALSGDQAALGSITQYADRFIEAQKGWSASGEQTVSTIDRVTGMLEKLPDQLSPEQFLAEEFKGIIDGQTAALLSGWDGGFDSLLSGLSADFGALDTSLDGLLSFDELKAGLAGKATDSELRALIGAVDKNGDGLISRQELTNATISDLRLGITSTLSKSFADLDSNVDGLLTFGELKAGLGGIATDETLRAMMHGMDLNNDGVINKLESIVIAEMPNDAVLTNVLKNKMDALGSKTLTAAQVKQALSPIASDEDIAKLIRRVDKNGDGIISAEELTATRVAGLTDGIAGALEPMFSSIDLDASGLIDYSEFGKAFEGMATDEQLKNIFSELDRNGDGVISKLEAMHRSSMDAEGSIKTIEDFFYRAGSPSWGLRVSMSHHQNVDAVKSFGYHTAKEMRREFSPSGTGIGVSLAAPQNGDGARSIATAFKQILGPNTVNGSHADGLARVPFDGYIAELHKDETVLTADQSDALRGLASGSSLSMASMPAPAVTMSAPPLPQFPLLNTQDVTQVMRDMQRTIEQKNEQIVELLKEVRGNTGQTRDAVMGVGKGAHQQREQQSRQLDRLNRNTKEKVRTP
ncbi:phage tail tape measure protein [Vreelandella venusta]|uniref:phage tail tape measure protein n=1 Tax=Vreelandella venusta TaxID=44935 RepID=UPI00200E2F5D|nr:phage tail tape measure protein [Halomonas venusta]UQI38783.1 phage tail tape measure protein [Halomonas venusta]